MRTHFIRPITLKNGHPAPKSFLLAVALALAVMPFAFGSALAAPGTPGGTPTSTESRHCVTFMEEDTAPRSAAVEQQIAALAARSGKPVSVERAGERSCFATDAELQQLLKARDVMDGSEKDGSKTGQVSAMTIGTGGYSIASLFSSYGYGGDSELFVSSTTCYTSAKYYNYVGNWINDRTSSSKAYSGVGCSGAQYYLAADFNDGPYYCADPDSITGHCWYVGDSINDQTSSLGVY